MNTCYQLLLLLTILSVMACTDAKRAANTPVNKDNDFYSSIVKSEARLHAMSAGKYVMYENTTGKYRPWLVNEGKDSVVIYNIPAGEPTKDGLWMYSCQVLTSLPNAPIYKAFFKLEAIDRDTIKSVYYEAPDDFDISLDKILLHPKNAFQEISFDQLKLSKDGEQVTYLKKGTLLFEGESPEMTGKTTKEYGHYMKDYYTISPNAILYNRYLYNKDKTNFEKGDHKLVKIQEINEKGLLKKK